MKLRLLQIGILFAASAFGQNRYAVILEDEPVAARISSRAELQSAGSTAYRQSVESKQQTVRNAITSRRIGITGSVTTLLNAVFVTAPSNRVAELKALPGVRDVVPVRRHKALLSRAVTLMNGPQAWNLTPGGLSNAGAGVKIAILDTGVDQNHPVFQDPSLKMPAGYPKGDAAFTNSKVIVARSYIRQLGAGTNATNPAADSRPDDFTPRDHIGHGTATASAAAGFAATGTVAISGMAPKAWIGNYRIIGSPELNDGTFDDIMILALDDAINDGMDIVSMSVAGSAFTGPLDTGAACGRASGVPCDLSAWTFEQAAVKGMTILIAAGNEGPDNSTIDSPATAPSILAIGATTNSHTFAGLVQVTGTGVPLALSAITAVRPTQSSASGGALTGPLVDVTTLGDDGLACAPLPPYSLNGAIALILRGTCDFSVKMTHAVTAGAAGVIFYMADGRSLLQPGGLGAFLETAAMVSNSDGLNLKNFIATHPAYPATLNPSAVEVSGTTANNLASFSSRGPGSGLNGLKPDLLAVGSSLYMAAQSYDRLGPMYSANGFINSAGTSFATPLAAGAAALVKQNHPAYTAAQIRSALVNTAAQDVITDGGGGLTNILATGGGRLQADLAVKSNLTAVPASLSFGSLTKLPASLSFTLSNTGTTAAALNLSVSQTATAANVTLALSSQSVTLAAGANTSITLAATGTAPAPGVYSGAVVIAGGSVGFRVPYMFIVGGTTPTRMLILSGDSNDGTANQIIPDEFIAFKVVDNNGMPLASVPVSFNPSTGLKLTNVSSATDAFGMAYATVTMGPTAGLFQITATAGTLTHTFTEYSRTAPAISAAGVVNAASYQQPIAPGSYITIFGTGLYDPDLSATGNALEVNSQPRLPLVIDYTAVSFDVPGASPPISLPGRLYFISGGQIGLQVPWELKGQASAQVKVSINYSAGNVVTIPLSAYSPALFAVGTNAAATNDKGVITLANPAVRDSVITLYGNGLGPVDNTPPTGEPTPLSPLARTTTIPVVRIGGVDAEVFFSGLAPGAIGLYQINVRVPLGITAGSQPVVVNIGAASSKLVNLPVL